MNPAYLRLALFAAVATLCSGQDEGAQSSLTARQLFYSPPAPQAKPVPPKQPRTPKPKPKPDAGAATPHAAAAAEPAPPETPKPPQSEARTSYLGLRYIVRQLINGEMRDVDPEKTFVSGDRIKLGIESNDTAYLYVVQEGSDGRWDVLYPAGGSQHKVSARMMIDIPAGTDDFAFDQTPGTERLLVVLSRTPETDLEKLVASLRNAKYPNQPSSRPPVMMASVPDMQKFRATLTSRNLRIQKRPQVGGKVEEAVYIVNASSGDSSHSVVAEIVLKHR